jgi:hypothetical protein
MSLKDLIFNDSGKNKKDVDKATKTQSQPSGQGDGAVFSPNPVQPNYGGSQPNYGNSQINGVVDDKFVAMLEKIVADNNQSGVDYFEFKEALKNLANIPMDEGTKILTAYNILRAQGCSKTLLLSSIDKYVELIQNEQNAFNNEMATKIQQTVSYKRTEAEKAQNEVNELNARINELNTFIITSNQEANNEEVKLKMAEANFKQSVNKVISVLTTDKEKISNYIKEE